MPVLVEGISVIVRAGRILRKYAGGLEAFAADCPNKTFCFDGELARVGFMNMHDALDYVTMLAGHGLTHLQEGQAEDLVLVDQLKGMLSPCPWLEVGQSTIGPSSCIVVGACKLAGSPLSNLVVPDGWVFEESLSCSANMRLIETGREDEFLDQTRHEDGVDISTDLRSGEEVYIARARQPGE